MSGQTSSTPPPPEDHAGDHAAGNTQDNTGANVSATAAIGRNSARRDASVAAICGLVVALMVGSAYAAVPLYDWFCRVTGFNGTTQRATAMPTGEPGRKITVRFDSNISGGLPWRFRPEKTEIDVRIGEVVTAYYTVTNLSARHTMAQAGYNVAPLTAGAYFQKINCFCFTDQEMGPGETREMAVVFYVDEAIGKDVDHSNLDTLTLSYTFYPVKDDKVKPLAAAPSATGKGNL